MTDARVATIRCEGSQDAPAAVFGSGYLIAEKLVLTAAHVVQSAKSIAEIVEVRLNEQILHGRTIWLASGADGDSQPLDAAIVEIDDESYQPAPLPRIRWGRIVGRGSGVQCSATGFPDAVVGSTGRAEPQQIEGTINPLSRGRRGMLDIIPTAWPQWRPDSQTLWSGMSGAAVLSQTGQLLIGIVVETANNFEDRLLTALPIALLEQDRSFVDLWERQTDHPFWLEPVEMETILRPWHRSITARSPMALLRPEYEVAPFHGRAETLDRFVTWCETGSQLSGLLLHAPGGTGKTRLARELGRVMYHKGWTVGEVSDNPSNLAPLTQATTPILLLIDYAESRTEPVTILLRFLVENPGQHSIRVLLLARSASQWWEQLLQDYPVASVLQNPPRELGSIEFESDPAGHFARLSEALQHALAQIPGYENYAQPVPAFQLPWDLPRTTIYQPLRLHLAILARILATGEGVQEDSPPEQILLRHEKQYWNRLAKERSIEFFETRETVLVFSLLCGAHSKAQALSTISILPGFREDSLEDGRRALAHWIATLYPSADPSAEYWGALTPDWLFEYLMIETMRGEPDLLEHLAHLKYDSGGNAATVLTGAQLYRAVTVLTSAASHQTEAAGVLRQKLLELVAIHNGIFIPIACDVSVRSLDPTPLIVAIRVIIEHRNATLEILSQIRRFMPPAEGVLSALGTSLQQRIVNLLRNSDETENRDSRLASELNLLGIYLAKSDRIQEAVAASAESVAIYKGYFVTQGENLTGYGYALANHANNLGKDGNWEESYRTAREAVELVADISPVPPEYTGVLVGALNSIYLYHERRGELDEARDALARAMALQRDESLSEAHQSLFELENLGNLLLNQASLHRTEGNATEELRVRSECYDIFRRLYLAQPASYADAFQARTIELAHLFEEAGRHAEAAALCGEAAEALFRLWNDGRSSFQLKLGLALMLQAQELSRARAPFASVVHILERSCTVMQQLFRRDPAISARHYFEVLRGFIQGAQLVENDIEIKPYMAEVATVLDYIVSEWETAGRMPDDDLVVPNMAMFLTWAIESGDLVAAVRLCERAENLLGDDSDNGEIINRKSLHGTILMLRAKALARMHEYPVASRAAMDGTEKLTSCSSLEFYWPAYVAAEALHDIARRLPTDEAFQESLTLTSAGIALSRRFLPSDQNRWVPILCNHVVHAARLEASRGEHATAAGMLEEALELTRWLVGQDGRSQNDPDPIVGFSVHQPAGPSAADSLDQVLGIYIVELQQLGRIDDLGPVLAELIEVRKIRYEADSDTERLLDLVWANLIYAQHLLNVGRDEEAVAAAHGSLASLEMVPDTSEPLQQFRGSVLHENALVLARADHLDEALATISASVDIYRRMNTKGRSSREMAAVLGDMSTMLSLSNQHESSLALGEEAMHIWRNLADSGSTEDQHGLVVALHNRIRTLHDAGLIDEATTLFEELQLLVENSTAVEEADTSNQPLDSDSAGSGAGEGLS